MSAGNVDDLSSALENTRVSPSGVSFAGKALKLDSEDDAKEVIEEIDNCKDLNYLNLQGNTLGVEASKGIAKALEKHSEFKRALWKDMFTGRMKTEIPQALQYLGNGLVTAQARLTELDLSDNAFGPIGVEGLAALLRSSSCYSLEELRLNNNGLGITGGKLLAAALTDCYNCSKKEGKPLALKVFIAGRNRLENEGATALAEVFKMIGTLEEIAMPQNGIYHVGITALSQAFAHNKNLKILNLSDNTIGPKGSEVIGKVLPSLQQLQEINFGDCLLKTKGAIFLAEALKQGHTSLETLILEGNEINKEGGMHLARAMDNKTKLKVLNLDSNQFGKEGRDEMKSHLKQIGKFNALSNMSDDESEDSEESDAESDGESSDSGSCSETSSVKAVAISAKDFISSPSAENLLALGDKRDELILKEAKTSDDINLDNYMSVLMKVGSLGKNNKEPVREASIKCSEFLYRELFTWAQKTDNISIVNNSLLVNLGLIKSEDKKRPTCNVEACLNCLQNVVTKNYIPESTKNTLKVFMQRDIDNKTEPLEVKKKLLSQLS